MTIDHWESFEAFTAFRREFSAEFEAIDRRFEHITTEESKLGEFDAI